MERELRVRRCPQISLFLPIFSGVFRCFKPRADHFVFLSEEKNYLELLIPAVGDFLEKRLKLFLHSDKVFIKTIASGVDFLGWVNFGDYRILRGTTKRRMLKRVRLNPQNETIQSYLGLLGHGNAYDVQDELKDKIWPYNTRIIQGLTALDGCDKLVL